MTETRPVQADITDHSAQLPGAAYALADPVVAGPGSSSIFSSLLARSSAARLLLPADLIALLLPATKSLAHWKLVVVVALLTMVLLNSGGFYRARLSPSVLDEAPGLVGRLLIATCICSTLQVLRTDDIGLRVLLRSVVASLLLILLFRSLIYAAIRAVRRSRRVAHSTVVVGSGPIAMEIVSILERYPSHGLQVIGVLDSTAPLPATMAHVPHLGAIDDLPFVLDQRRPKVVIIADGAFHESDMIRQLRTLMNRRTAVLIVPRMHELYTTTGATDHIGAVGVIRVRPPVMDGPARLLKRAVDILASVVALVLLSPLLALVAVLVRLESGPGFLFRQTRLGIDGQPFELLKFRSLRSGTDAEDATEWCIADDRRVRPVGRLIRRTSIDELPQLWNILRGDMTIVGPRPERPHFAAQFSEEYRNYALRHRVPAGLTGLAQVSGLRGDTSISDRARYDNYYIDHWSLWLDFKVIFRTVREVVGGAGRRR